MTCIKRLSYSEQNSGVHTNQLAELETCFQSFFVFCGELPQVTQLTPRELRDPQDNTFKNVSS